MTNPTLDKINAEVDSTGKNQYVWKGKFEITVADLWVADGFNLSDKTLQEMLHDALERWLCCAYAGEFSVSASITSAPNPDSISKEQGYA